MSDTLEEAEDANSAKVGDRVQWTSQGQLQPGGPFEVLEIQEYGGDQYLRIRDANGQKGSIPMSQATLDPNVGASPPVPPPRPFAPPTAPATQARQDLPGTKRDVFALEDGEVFIQWPASISADDYADLGGWLDMIKRKIGRSVVDDTDDE